MQDIAERHSHWVANFFVGKVKEFHHYLQAIVDACDRSLQHFQAERGHDDGLGPAVIYAFSSFSNAIQSLKDMLPKLTSEPFPWSEIGALRHGTFLSQTRNAATHDGNPIINAWASGMFFIGSDIRRLDDKGRLVQIRRPTEDVRTICLQFARDFSALLHERIQGLGDKPPIRGAVLDLTDVDEAMTSDFVPEFAKRLFYENREEIAQQLASASHYPAEAAISRLEVVMRYCDERIQAAAPSPQATEQFARMLGSVGQQDSDAEALGGRAQS